MSQGMPLGRDAGGSSNKPAPAYAMGHKISDSRAADDGGGAMGAVAFQKVWAQSCDQPIRSVRCTTPITAPQMPW